MQVVTMRDTHKARRERFMISLDGLSVGDAYGEAVLDPKCPMKHLLGMGDVPVMPYTDDTEMALGILNMLDESHEIDPQRLAEIFGARWKAKPMRGYGGGARLLLKAYSLGSTYELALEMFDGTGSMGNGSAMRVAPLGAYFADAGLDMVAEQAEFSSLATHTHDEGIAGAVAVAVAAAACWIMRDHPRGQDMFSAVLKHVPPSLTMDKIEQAAQTPLSEEPKQVAWDLGNGHTVLAQDTVPYALWCVSRHIEDYREAILTAVSVGGDIDTLGAIVGGIVVLSAGRDSIPTEWIDRREALKLGLMVE